MTSLTDKTSSSQPEPTPGAGRAPPEPFGQTGIRQYFLPVLATLSFVFACAAGIMWMRSRSVADIFSRRDGAVTWSVRSIYGRILITRTDLRDADNDDVPGIPFSGGGWQYAAFEIPDTIPDGWQETWRKTLGVEWRSEALFRHPAVVGGWWMRIRWMTITLVLMVPPLTIAIVHDLRQRRRARRTEARALAAGAPDAPAPSSS